MPDGVTNISVETIGQGGIPRSQLTNINGNGQITYATHIAGGGGAYALNYFKVTSGSAVYLNIAPGGSITNKNTWLNISSNAIPTSLSKGVLAAGAGWTNSSTATVVSGISYPLVLEYSSGGQASNSLGLITYSGGDGGVGYSVANNSYSNNYAMGNPGGGGAAGPNGPGAKGGNGFYNAVNFQGGGSGGGGGANGGTQGVDATSTAGASGGSNRSGTAGGAGNTIGSTTAPANGSNGSGGGGGSYANNATAIFYYNTATTTTRATLVSQKGGNGSTEVISAWNTSGSTAYGPGSGGGGAGKYYSYNSNGYGSANQESSYAGSGGTYGGGVGGGSADSYPYTYYSFFTSSPTPGQGLVIIQYTVTKNSSSAFLPLFI